MQKTLNKCLLGTSGEQNSSTCFKKQCHPNVFSPGSSTGPGVQHSAVNVEWAAATWTDRWSIWWFPLTPAGLTHARDRSCISVISSGTRMRQIHLCTGPVHRGMTKTKFWGLKPSALKSGQPIWGIMANTWQVAGAFWPGWDEGNWGTSPTPPREIRRQAPQCLWETSKTSLVQRKWEQPSS